MLNAASTPRMRVVPSGWDRNPRFECPCLPECRSRAGFARTLSEMVESPSGSNRGATWLSQSYISMPRNVETSSRPRAGVRSLIGRTIRWTFRDRGGGETVYHHTFPRDGTIVYRGESLSGQGKRIRASRALVRKLSDGLFLMSYLNPPYTLTAVLDSRGRHVQGVASSDKTWIRFEGTWEVVHG